MVTSSGKFSWPENEPVPPFPILHTFKLLDQDGIESGFLFDWVGGNASDGFILGHFSGNIYPLRPLNYEEEQAFYGQVLASDAQIPPQTLVVNVSVTVLDVPENPVLPDVPAELVVEENTPVSEVLISCECLRIELDWSWVGAGLDWTGLDWSSSWIGAGLD